MNVPSGKYTIISIEAILAACKEELQIESSDQDIGFFRLINEAMRHTDCLSLFKKNVCVLDVDCNVAVLPQGFFQMLALRIGEPPNCLPGIYVDFNFLTSCGCSGGFNNLLPFSNSYQIQNGNIVFHQNAAPSDSENAVPQVPITSCTIAYIGMNVDSDGLFKIYPKMERAIVAYVAYKFTRRNFERYPVNVRNDYRLEWEAQKRWIKGTDFYDEFNNTRWQLQEWASAIIGDKIFSP